MLRIARNGGPARVAGVMFMALFVLLLAGCVTPAAAPEAAVPAEEPASGETVELVYQDWATTWFPPMVDEMMPIFYEDNPNIEVTYVPQSDDVDVKLLAQMVAGEAPDLMFGCCTWFPIIAQKGQLLDLRPYVESTWTRPSSRTSTRPSTTPSSCRTAPNMHCPSITARWPSSTTRTCLTSMASNTRRQKAGRWKSIRRPWRS